MKRTGAAILSLALAMILVSSLASGVILAKSLTERDVAILDCGFVLGGGEALLVIGFETNAPFENTPDIVIGITTCVEGIALLVDDRFKMEDGSAGMNGQNIFSRYTFLRKRKVKE